MDVEEAVQECEGVRGSVDLRLWRLENEVEEDENMLSVQESIKAWRVGVEGGDVLGWDVARFNQTVNGGETKLG